MEMHQCNFDPPERRWHSCPRQPVCNRLLPSSWRSGNRMEHLLCAKVPPVAQVAVRPCNLIRADMRTIECSTAGRVQRCKCSLV